MFNKFFRRIKSFGKKVKALETVVYGERVNFMEVLERNLALEKEIAERTEELNQANRSVLTLKHIWSTMNSSEPLGEVLRTIVDAMCNDLGYLHCFIFQKFGNENGEYLKIRESTRNDFTEKIRETLEIPFDSFFIPLSETENVVVKALIEGNIINIKKFSSIFTGATMEMNPEKEEKLNHIFTNRAASIIPIIFHGKMFGCLVAVGIRNEISDTEKNFLTLFAKQIELAVTIADLFQTIRDQAITDSLTGLFNRRHFEQCLEREVQRSTRLKQPFTLISLDLDFLKSINDTFGHSVGDAAIETIGKILRKNARSIDIPARQGGEEFAVMLPGVDLEGGMIAAERLRATIESTPVNGVGQITASIGIGTFLKHSDKKEELIELVDQAMYRAKRNGRNQVQIAQAWDENIWKRQAMDSLLNLLTKKVLPIDQDLAVELIEKLKNSNAYDNHIDDLIFIVVNEFTSLYKPMYQKGNIKEKINIIVKIAERLEVPQEDIDKIKMAAMVYDISNIMLPESILLKEGPLDDSERRLLLKNPVIAAKEILDPMGTTSNIMAILESWNEYYDGSGYPGLLKGDEIPIGTSILVVVDTYYALINSRPYRKAFTKQKALKILEDGADKKWNGKIINIFKEVIEEQTEKN